MIYTATISNWEGRIIAQKIFTNIKKAEQFTKQDKYEYMITKIKKTTNEKEL